MHINKIFYYLLLYSFLIMSLFSEKKLKMEYRYNPKIKIFFSKNWEEMQEEMQKDKQKYLENATSLKMENMFFPRVNYNIAMSNRNFDENKTIIYFRKFKKVANNDVRNCSYFEKINVKKEILKFFNNIEHYYLNKICNQNFDNLEILKDNSIFLYGKYEISDYQVSLELVTMENGNYRKRFFRKYFNTIEIRKLIEQYIDKINSGKLMDKYSETMEYVEEYTIITKNNIIHWKIVSTERREFLSILKSMFKDIF